MNGKSITANAIFFILGSILGWMMVVAGLLDTAPVWLSFLGGALILVVFAVALGNVFKRPAFVRTGLDRTDRIFVAVFVLVFIVGLIGLALTSVTLSLAAFIALALVGIAIVAVAIFRMIRDSWRERRSKRNTQRTHECTRRREIAGCRLFRELD
jgi:hypothetical protein